MKKLCSFMLVLRASLKHERKESTLNSYSSEKAKPIVRLLNGRNGQTLDNNIGKVRLAVMGDRTLSEGTAFQYAYNIYDSRQYHF